MSRLPEPLIPATRPPSRILSIDMARTLAIAFMVQGHALDVLLAPKYRGSTAFNLWLFLRGLTAPTFLLLSGLSFVVASTRRWDSYLHNSTKFWRRITRFAALIFIGYLMHSPVRSLRDLPSIDAARWQSWLAVDVLQCIGLTLLVLQLLIPLARTTARVANIAGSAACVVALVTPFLWTGKLNGHLPAVIAAYCNGLGGSLFPLFPWAAYLCAGVWLGHWYMQQAPGRAARWLALGGCLLLVSGLLLGKLTTSMFPNLDFWRTSPSLFVLRVGCVSLVLSALQWISAKSWIPRTFVQTLARESLLIYVVHVAILYGSAWNKGLRQYIGAVLGPTNTILWIAVLLIAMTMLALGWNQVKTAFASLSISQIFFARLVQPAGMASFWSPSERRANAGNLRWTISGRGAVTRSREKDVLDLSRRPTKFTVASR